MCIILCSNFLGQLIPGSVPVQNWTADDRSISETFITAPAQALHLSAGDIYAPSIMVAESGGSLLLKLGENCNISGETFNKRHCPIIDSINITTMTYYADQLAVRTLYFNIAIDNGFIDGQANMTVTFIHIINRIEHNISGYLYFDSQPTAGCNPSTSIQPPPINHTPTLCDCPTTGNSDPTQTTDTTCQTTLTSGSMLNRLDLPGSVFIVTVSLLLFAT